MRNLLLCIWIALIWIIPVIAQDDAATDPEAPFVFGMVLVGPLDDEGWSQTHYEGGVFVTENTNAEMLVYENYNETTADEKPMSEIVDEFVEAGAQLIILTSDEFQQEAEEVARLHPGIVFLHISGDSVLTGTAPDNLGNLMAQMEWGKLIAGCSAAMMTETGQIGYLGPLINSETRRLASSAYLGARHCYDLYRPDLDAPLQFRVEWIGFWFFIDGVTEDPTLLTQQMYADGIDVVISGIDTPEALTVAAELHNDGANVYATSYNSDDTCDRFVEICIGTAFYNWGPAYLDIVEQVADDTWEPAWLWIKPNTLFRIDTIVGFEIGEAYNMEDRTRIRNFRGDLNGYSNNNLFPTSLPLWQGPLELQDGTLLVEDGQLMNVLDVWYLPQLLQGMQGESFAEEQ